jgi:AcrR family transcriptional regulator
MRTMRQGTQATPRPARRRTPVTGERILRAALRIADTQGIEAVSMRKLGQALRVEAMSLYKHVAGKEDVLDGLVDLVMAEVELPADDADWRSALRQTAISVHGALLHHPWAAPVFESRLTPGPARLRYLDAVVGVLQRAGFSLPDVARVLMALDSHVYGFVLQETSLAFTMDDAPRAAADIAARAGDEYPNLREIADRAATDPAAFPVDFEFGLDLLLDGFARMLPGPERETARSSLSS